MSRFLNTCERGPDTQWVQGWVGNEENNPFSLLETELRTLGRPSRDLVTVKQFSSCSILGCVAAYFDVRYVG